jgi:4-hydroxybenzoate polyprenyltransferase
VSAPETRPADAGYGLVDVLPGPARPYARLARLDRPAGWQLLLIPCAFSEALAAHAGGFAPSIAHLALFLVGAVVMRGAGSAWNDLLDRDIDAKVARTRGRPIASGAISPRAALAFIVGLSLVGFLVLIQFNLFAILAGVASLGLVALYPLAKRVTSHPQIVLGFVFAWGALMGWAAHFGSLGPAPILLYLAVAAWIVGYDTIYAMQDIEDDAIIGVGSTARAYGPAAHRFVAVCYAAAAVLAGLAFALAGGAPAIALLPAWLAFAGGLAQQIRAMRRRGVPLPPGDALALFKSNVTLGAVVAGLMLLATFA